MFVDIVKISLRAGNGGDGAVSFHREKYVNAGGPDGGNGGRGGDIVFVSDDNLSTLIDFRYQRKYVAASGAKGEQKRSSGKSAPDTIIKVPRGTVIKDSNTGRIIADISDDEPVIICHGGKGGRGNMNFATPTRQVPRFAKPGVPGEVLEVTLELKLLADVGLVGFPNVGKSSLISVISAAKPEIANYPFTTITPVLGVVKVGEKSFVVADIPGLIEGASEGVGLGHAFLRHVERCRLIIHVVDISAFEGRDPVSDYEKINYELANFSKDLATRPQVVAGNKADIATTEQLEAFAAYMKEKNVPYFVISAATTQGVQALVNHVAALLPTLPETIKYKAEPLTELEVETALKKTHEFTVTKLDDGIFSVEAPFMIPIISKIDVDDYESMQYFQRVLRFSGIIDKLEEAGIEEEDTVSIYDLDFQYFR